MEPQYFIAYAINGMNQERTLLDAVPEKTAVYLAGTLKESDYVLLVTHDGRPFLLGCYGTVSYCAKQQYLMELCHAFRTKNRTGGRG